MTLPKPAASNYRVIPAAIDEIAAQEPSAVWAFYPKSSTSYDDGFHQVTYAELANAINGAAWWFKKTLGVSNSFETLAYVGPNDLYYPVILTAAVKTGYRLLLSSPLNPTSSHVGLFETLECKGLITPAPESSTNKAIAEAYALEKNVVAPPPLDELFGQQHEPFPYTKTWEEAQHDPLVVLHTSGSTGVPKPIRLSHLFATTFANMSQLEPPTGYVNQTRFLHGKTIFSPLPFYHGVGVDFGYISTVFNRTTIVYPLTDVPPTGSAVAAAVKQIKIDSAHLPAPIIEDIVKSESLSKEVIPRLESIVYTGGDLSQDIGDRIAERLHLFSIFGRTEMGHAPQIELKDRDWKDWKYLQWNEEVFGVDWQEGAPGLYEFCIQKNDTLYDYQTEFKVFPDRTEIRSNDLWRPHPEKKGLWCYAERADNIIVFLNGEKLNPSSAEGIFISNPEVTSALMIGTKRYQAAVLLQMTNPEFQKDRAQAIEALWPTIEKANQNCPPYAKLSKSSVIFTDPEKPMIRTFKNTINRQKTITAYSEEIEQFYAGLASESEVDDGDMGGEDSKILQDPEALKSYLQERILKVMDWSSFERTDDLFAAGMDSVRALQLLRNLRSLSDVNLGTIYQHPTIDSLAQAMIDAGDSSKKAAAGSEFDIVMTTLKDFEQEVEKMQPIVSATENSSKSTGSGEVVLLTGSTGNIGGFILHSLLQDSQIAHVYCINRSANADRNLSPDYDRSKVTFLTGNASKDQQFGLDDSAFNTIGSQVTRIIHNAWTVDFNLSLESFLIQVTGIVNLIRFAAAGKGHPSVTFLSSISSVQAYPEAVVPEAITTEASVSGPTGYGQSKWIAENLLDFAARKFGIDTRVLRLGQVAGPLHLDGMWSRNEWLPSMVISSAALGQIPDTLPKFITESGVAQEVTWVPVDCLAEVVAKLATSKRPESQESASSGAYVRHLANPKSCSWLSLVPGVIEAVGPIRKADNTTALLQCVPYPTWLETLQDSAKTMDDKDLATITKTIPAFKLLEFFAGLGKQNSIPRLGTELTERDSAELRNLQAVTPVAMQKWTRAWLE